MFPRIPASDPEGPVRAAHALDEGGLVVFPSGHGYVLGADALEGDAVERAFEALRRPADEGIPVAVPDLERAQHLAVVTPLARRLAAQAWRGPVLFELRARPTAPEALLGGSDRVGVFVPQAPFALAVCAHFGPVTAARAGLHLRAPLASLEGIRGELGERVALFVDAGPSPWTSPTVVDASGGVPLVVREGAVPRADIEANAPR